jgi:hypothetical protein
MFFRNSYRVKYLLLLISFLFLFVTSIRAEEYYVSALSGSDTNTGLLQSTALKTLQRAANQVTPGDTVFILDGVYYNLYLQ